MLPSTADTINFGQHSDFDFGTGSFSVGVWVNPAPYPATHYLLRKVTGGVAGWYLYTDAAGSFYAVIQGGGSVRWTARMGFPSLFVFVADRSAGYLYLYRNNDTRKASGAATVDVNIAADLFLQGPERVEGMAMWKRAIGPSEVSDWFSEEKVPVSPIAHFPMQETSGNVVDVISGHVGTVSVGCTRSTSTRGNARTAAAARDAGP